MTEKQFAKGIFIKKFNGAYGEWLSVSIKVGENEYKNYKFYPRKEQKTDKYVEFYGVVDDWKPTKQTKEEIIDDEIPF